MDGGVAGAAWPHGPVAEFSGAQGWCQTGVGTETAMSALLGNWVAALSSYPLTCSLAHNEGCESLGASS
jgi:hypothetical protein